MVYRTSPLTASKNSFLVLVRKRTTFMMHLERTISKLFSEGQPTTAGSCRCSLNSIKTVSDRKKLLFKEVTQSS
jgi:hypothetical protein